MVSTTKTGAEDQRRDRPRRTTTRIQDSAFRGLNIKIMCFSQCREGFLFFPLQSRRANFPWFDIFLLCVSSLTEPRQKDHHQFFWRPAKASFVHSSFPASYK